MSDQPFTIEDLMSLLVAKVGLPPELSTTDPAIGFADVGLDSLAFLQLQAEVQSRYGIELPDEASGTWTFGEIAAKVNEHLRRRTVA